MEQISQQPPRQKKILLVEDDPLLADIYATKFRESGFAITVVERGEEALEAIQKDRPDVVLLDIVLPHVDGWDILISIKEAKDLKDMRVVVLSNLGQKEEIDKGIQLGATKYLIKAHYTPSEVVQEVVGIV